MSRVSNRLFDNIVAFLSQVEGLVDVPSASQLPRDPSHQDPVARIPPVPIDQSSGPEEDNIGLAAAISTLHIPSGGGGAGTDISSSAAAATTGLLKWSSTYRSSFLSASVDTVDDTRLSAVDGAASRVEFLEGAVAAVAPDVKVTVSFGPIGPEGEADAVALPAPTPTWNAQDVVDGLAKSNNVAAAVGGLIQIANATFTTYGVAVGSNPAREEASVLRADQLMRALGTQFSATSTAGSGKSFDEVYGSSGALLDATLELLGVCCGIYTTLDRDIKATSELLFKKWFSPLASIVAPVVSAADHPFTFDEAFPLRACIELASKALGEVAGSADTTSRVAAAQTLLVSTIAALVLIGPHEQIIEKIEEKPAAAADGETPAAAPAANGTAESTTTPPAAEGASREGTATTATTATDGDKKPVIREVITRKPLFEGCFPSVEWASLITNIVAVVGSSMTNVPKIPVEKVPVAPVSKDIFIKSVATVKDAENKPNKKKKADKKDSNKKGISPQKRKEDLRNARKSRIPIFLPRGCVSVTLSAHDSLIAPMQVTLCGCNREQEAAKTNKQAKVSDEQSALTNKWSVFESSIREGVSRTFSCHLSSRNITFDDLPQTYLSRHVIFLSVPVDCAGSFTITCNFSASPAPTTTYPLASQVLGSGALQLAARAAWRALLVPQQPSSIKKKVTEGGAAPATAEAADDKKSGTDDVILTRKGVLGVLSCGPIDVGESPATLTPIESPKLKMMFAQCRAQDNSPWRHVIMELVNALEHACGAQASSEIINIVGRRWLFDWLPQIQGEINKPAKDNLLAICEFIRVHLHSGGAATMGPSQYLEAIHNVSTAGITAEELSRVLIAVRGRAAIVETLVLSPKALADRGAITFFAASHSMAPLFAVTSDFTAAFVGANHGARTAMVSAINDLVEGLAVTPQSRGLLLRLLEGQSFDACASIPSIGAVWSRLVGDANIDLATYVAPTTIASSDRGVRVASDARGALNTHCKTMGMIELRASTPWEPSALLQPSGAPSPMYYFEVTIQEASTKNFAIGLVPSDKLALKEPDAVTFSVDNYLHSLRTFNKRLWDTPVRKGDVWGCGLRLVAGKALPVEEADPSIADAFEVYFTLNGRLMATEALAKRESKKSRRQQLSESALGSKSPSKVPSSASLKSGMASAAPSSSSSSFVDTTAPGATVVADSVLYKFLTPVVSAETTNTATFVINFGQAPFVFGGHAASPLDAVSQDVFQRALAILSPSTGGAAAASPASEATKAALLRGLLPACVSFAVDALASRNDRAAARACADLSSMMGAWKKALLQEQDGDLEGSEGFSPSTLLGTLCEKLVSAITSPAPTGFNGASALMVDILHLIISVAAEDGDADALIGHIPLDRLTEFVVASISKPAVATVSERTCFPQWESTSSSEHTVVRGNAVQLDDERLITLAMGSPLPSASKVSFSIVFRRPVTSRSFLLLLGSLYVGVTSETTLPSSLTAWKSGGKTWALHEVHDDQLAGAFIAPRTEGVPLFTVGSVITVTVDRASQTLSFNCGGEELATVFRDIPADAELRPFVQLVGEFCTAFLLPSTYTVSEPDLASSLKLQSEVALARQLLTWNSCSSHLADAIVHSLASNPLGSDASKPVLRILGADPDLKHQTHVTNAPVELLYPLSGSSPQAASAVDKEGVNLTTSCYSNGLWRVRLESGNVCDALAMHLFPPANFIATAPFKLQDESTAKQIPLSSVCTTAGLERIATALSKLLAGWEKKNLVSGTLLQEERVARKKIEGEAMKTLYAKMGPIPSTILEELYSRNYALNEPVIQPTAVPPVMTFSQNDAHPSMQFPQHYRGSLALSPSQVNPDTTLKHSDGPYAAVVNEPIPASGSFDIRLVIEADWLALLPEQYTVISGACYVGLCTGAYRAGVRDHQRASVASDVTDMWAIPQCSTPKLHPKHSVKAPLSTRNFASGQTIRLHVNREKGTMELFIKSKSNTEVAKGVFFANLPKDIALYPFVQLPGPRHSALLLPEKGSLPRAIQNKNIVAASVSHCPDDVQCSGCARSGGEGEKLRPPNWFRCNECTKFDLCTVCMNNHVHPGHTFTQMRSSSFAPSHVLSDDAAYVALQKESTKKNKACPVTTTEVPAVPAILEHLSEGSYVCGEESDLKVNVSASANNATPLARWALLRASTALARTTAEVTFEEISEQVNDFAIATPLDAIIGVGTRESLANITSFDDLKKEMYKPLRPGAYPTFIALDTADIGASQQQQQLLESVRDSDHVVTPLSHMYRAMKPAATTSDFITVTISNSSVSIAVSGQHVSTTSASMSGLQLVLVVAFNPQGAQGVAAAEAGTIVSVRNPLSSVSLGKVSERHDLAIRLANSAQSRWVTRSQLREPIVLVGATSYLYEGLRCFITVNPRTAAEYPNTAFIPVVVTSIAKVDHDIVKVHDGTEEQEYPARTIWVLAKDNNDKLGEGDHLYPSEKRRLRAFYKKYAPEKTEAEMDTAIDKFSESTLGLTGMFKALVKKYGPEPDLVIDLPHAAVRGSDSENEGVKVPILDVGTLMQLLLAVNGVISACASAKTLNDSVYSGPGGLRGTLESLVRTFAGPSRSAVHTLPLAIKTLWQVTHPATIIKSTETPSGMKLPFLTDSAADSTTWNAAVDTYKALSLSDPVVLRLHSVTSLVSCDMEYSTANGSCSLTVAGGRMAIAKGSLKAISTTPAHSRIQSLVVGFDPSNANARSLVEQLEGLLNEKCTPEAHRGLPDAATHDGITVAIQLKVDTHNGVVSWWTSRGHRGTGSIVDPTTRRPYVAPAALSIHPTGTSANVTETGLVSSPTEWHNVARDAIVASIVGLRRVFVTSASNQFEALDAAYASEPAKEAVEFVEKHSGFADSFLRSLFRLALADASIAPAFLASAATLRVSGVDVPLGAGISLLQRWWLHTEVIRQAKPFLAAAFAANKKATLDALAPILAHYDNLLRSGFKSRELYSAVLDTFAEFVFDDKTTLQATGGRALPYALVPLIVDIGASIHSKQALPACTSNPALFAHWEPLCDFDKKKDEKAPTIKLAGGGLLSGALRSSVPLSDIGNCTYFEVVQPPDARILIGIVDEATLASNLEGKELLSLTAFDGVNVERKSRCSRHSWFYYPSTGDVLGCAVDLDQGTVTFNLNNTVCNPAIKFPKGSAKVYAYVAVEESEKPLEVLDTRVKVQYLPLGFTPLMEPAEEAKLRLEPYSEKRAPLVADGDGKPSEAQLKFIEQTVKDLFPFVDMSSRLSATATAIASLKNVLSAEFRDRVMATPAPLRQIVANSMGKRNLKTVSVKWFTLFSASPRTPQEALQHSVLAQLYQQFPKLSRNTMGGKSGSVVDAEALEQNPMFTTALSVTDSGHIPIDAGGPYKQVWSLLSEELMVVDNTDKPDFHRNPMFVQSLASKAKVMVPNRTLGVATEGRVGFEPYVASLFNFLGMVMGHMARAKFPIGLDLSAFVWKFIVEDPLTVEDYLADVDGHLKDVLQDAAVLTDDDEAAEMFPGFAAKLGEIVKEKGNGDDLANRKEAANWCIVHMLDKQLLPLRNGLQRVLGRDVVMSLDWRTLESMVCGEANPTFEQVKASINCSLPEPHVTMFWKALESLSPEQWGKFIFFCSSQRRLPLNRKIGVFPDARSSPNHLPVASTCFSQVRIPLYPTQEAWTAKITEAIECQQMELA